MPTVRKTLLYKYDELSDSAKEKARQWWAQHVFEDSCDWEPVLEDAVHVAEILGIEIDTHSVKLMSGKTREDPTIYFSGFNSQGDGACFEGSYRYAKGAAKAIREYAAEPELLRIADTLQTVQRTHFYRLRATMKHRGYYSHSGCMDVEVEDSEDPYRDIGDADADVRRLMRDFADWIYRQLEDEYEYQTSDEACEEAIRVNEYDFLEDGTRA